MVHNSTVLPPLDTLEAFACAARLGSFSAAAEELGITHGAVSRQIGRLERWMGVKLFTREARGVALTQEGVRFLSRTEEALALLGNTSERWTPRRNKSVVRISVTPSVASLWLFPNIARLEGEDMHIELVLDNRLADFGEGIDLAIRGGNAPWPGVYAQQLWHNTLYPIASPQIARQLGGRSDAASLMEMPLIHDSNIQGWKRWLAAENVAYVPRGKDRRFEDYNIVLEACAQGLGLALAWAPLSDEALSSGRLLPVSERMIDHHMAFHLVRPESPLRLAAATVAKRLLGLCARSEEEIAAFLAPLQ
ncbi:LysR family transcriptional regulator [Rhizobium sp. NRK18]|uniref:LysR family transcriptional regulator n=1 Tax=Rhizobium sp. NRK18 TaxID=2964667 RepID=UPI0021C4AF44|nr:LysR family transcriptional regulator [Rhizobium sp. NRK18]MCQ2005536.1 LysR family transcriptional regulator [Rhizobium sp. NRK18]